MRRVATLYRALMLLTPHPTLTEMKRFYSDLARRATIKVGDEEFLPVHDPIAEDLATSFSVIRRAPPEAREEVISREIASYEPTLYVAPHIEKRVESILATTPTKTVPREKHEKLLSHIKRLQTRRPKE